MKLIMIAALAFIREVVSQLTCKTGFLNAYNIDGQEAPRFQPMLLCQNVLTNCCSEFDEMKFHKNWYNYYEPKLRVTIDKVIKKYYKPLDKHWQPFANLDLMKYKELLKKDKLEDAMKVFQKIKASNMDMKMRPFELQWPSIRTFEIDAKRNFICLLCDQRNHESFDEEGKRFLINKSFCEPLLSAYGRKLQYRAFFYNKYLLLNHKLIQMFNTTYFFKENFDAIAEVRRNQDLVKKCFPTETAPYNPQNCTAVCNQYSITGLSPMFHGEFTFYDYMEELFTKFKSWIKRNRPGSKSNQLNSQPGSTAPTTPPTNTGTPSASNRATRELRKAFKSRGRSGRILSSTKKIATRIKKVKRNLKKYKKLVGKMKKYNKHVLKKMYRKTKQLAKNNPHAPLQLVAPAPIQTFTPIPQFMNVVPAQRSVIPLRRSYQARVTAHTPSKRHLRHKESEHRRRSITKRRMHTRARRRVQNVPKSRRSSYLHHRKSRLRRSLAGNSKPSGNKGTSIPVNNKANSPNKPLKSTTQSQPISNENSLSQNPVIQQQLLEISNSVGGNTNSGDQISSNSFQTQNEQSNLSTDGNPNQQNPNIKSTQGNGDVSQVITTGVKLTSNQRASTNPKSGNTKSNQGGVTNSGSNTSPNKDLTKNQASTKNQETKTGQANKKPDTTNSSTGQANKKSGSTNPSPGQANKKSGSTNPSPDQSTSPKNQKGNDPKNNSGATSVNANLKVKVDGKTNTKTTASVKADSNGLAKKTVTGTSNASLDKKDTEKAKKDDNKVPDFFSIKKLMEYYSDDETKIKSGENIRCINCTDSKWAINSENISKSNYTLLSKKVNNSTYVQTSQNITNSYNVTDSVDVRDSKHVFNSTNVTLSKDVYQSKRVFNSTLIHKSVGVYNSTNCTNCVNCTNCTNCRNSVNVTNCFGCKNVTNSSNLRNVTNGSYLVNVTNSINVTNLTFANKMANAYNASYVKDNYNCIGKQCNTTKFDSEYEVIVNKKLHEQSWAIIDRLYDLYRIGNVTEYNNSAKLLDPNIYRATDINKDLDLFMRIFDDDGVVYNYLPSAGFIPSSNAVKAGAVIQLSKQVGDPGKKVESDLTLQPDPNIGFEIVKDINENYNFGFFEEFNFDVKREAIGFKFIKNKTDDELFLEDAYAKYLRAEEEDPVAWEKIVAELKAKQATSKSQDKPTSNQQSSTQPSAPTSTSPSQPAAQTNPQTRKLVKGSNTRNSNRVYEQFQKREAEKRDRANRIKRRMVIKHRSNHRKTL